MRSLLLAPLCLAAAWPSAHAKSTKRQEKTATVTTPRVVATSTIKTSSTVWTTTTKLEVKVKGTSTASSKKAASTIPLTGNNVPTANPKKNNPLPKYWTGANSYYLHSYNSPDRIQVLDAMKSAGMSTVRIFLTYIYAGNKGSNNRELPDLEPHKLGVYDDTQLEAVDQLMVEAHARGIKLVIAVHDRYALGFWGTDVYATTFGIASEGSSGAQQIFDASVFYKSNKAMSYIDKRIRHVMGHKNKHTGLTWAQSEAYIYAIEAENEPMGHMDLAYPHWNCDRASTIRSTLPTKSRILVSTGGGITTQTSLADWAFSCPYFDIISVHDYGTTASVTANALKSAQAKTSKIVIMEEWGMTGDDKAEIVRQFVAAFKAAKVPWMYWEVTKPGQGSDNFEVWTDEPAWKAISGSSAGGINKRSLPDDGEDRSSSPRARSPLFVPAPNLVVPSARLLRARDGHVPQIGHIKRFVKHGKRGHSLAHAKMA